MRCPVPTELVKAVSWRPIKSSIRRRNSCISPLPALQYIRERYPRLVYVFAKRNIEEYRTLFYSDGEGYREEEFLAIVISDRGTLKYFLGDPEETLERTPGNKALLDAFLSKNWIEGYDVDEQDDSLYRAQGKAVYIKGKRS